MSSINDPEQLTGSSRIYSNAKPGIIMEAFSMAGESNLVFIINVVHGNFKIRATA